MIPNDSHQWSPPIVAGRQLPSYNMLAYLEKLGLVVLIIGSIGYVLFRSLAAGPVEAVRELGGFPR